MRLWLVTRRPPLSRGARKIRVERWAVMARTADTAIAACRDVHDATDPASRMDFVDGVWKAEPLSGPVALPWTFSDPTEEELADLAKRVAKRRPPSIS